MQNTLKIALIIIILIYIFFIIKSVKRKNMRINYLIFWSITAVILIISLLIPNLVEYISCKLGFEMPINMIFSLAIFIILYLIFNLTSQISNLERKNTALVQEVSILKKKIQDLEKLYNIDGGGENEK